MAQYWSAARGLGTPFWSPSGQLLLSLCGSCAVCPRRSPSLPEGSGAPPHHTLPPCPWPRLIFPQNVLSFYRKRVVCLLAYCHSPPPGAEAVKAETWGCSPQCPPRRGQSRARAKRPVSVSSAGSPRPPVVAAAQRGETKCPRRPANKEIQPLPVRLQRARSFCR